MKMINDRIYVWKLMINNLCHIKTIKFIKKRMGKSMKIICATIYGKTVAKFIKKRMPS